MVRRMKMMMAITLMFALSLLSFQAIYAEGAKPYPAKSIKASRDGLNFTISAANITVKFAGSVQVPKFQYWYNTTEPNKPIYQVFFHQLFEFNDTSGEGAYNATIDKIERMFALPSANLSLVGPENIIDAGEVIGVRFNFTITGRKGGGLPEANITLQCSLYNETQTVLVAGENKYNVTGGAELKIDVIMNSWPFKDDDNLLCLWWSVNQQNMTQEPTIFDTSVTFGRGYFSWTDEATVYNETYSEPVSVIGSFNMTGKTANVYLTYPNFQDKSLIHDPSLGVDITPPTVSIASPSAGSEVKSPSTKITWSGSDTDSGIDHYEVKLDKGSWVDAGNSTTYTFTNVDDGSHTVSVKAVDNAAISKEAQVSFTVNTSLIGGAGWFDDIAVFSIIATSIAIATFLLVRRR